MVTALIVCGSANANCIHAYPFTVSDGNRLVLPTSPSVNCVSVKFPPLEVTTGFNILKEMSVAGSL